MSLKELQENVLALRPEDRVQFFRWIHEQEETYGDVDPEAVAHIVSEVWAADEKRNAAN
jgi:hypothetical protein